MNHNMIRGTLYFCGFAAPVWALLASFWSISVFLALIIVGMLAITAAGFIEVNQ